MKTRNKIFNLLVMLSMLSFTACSSGGDGDEPGGGNNSGFSGSDFGEVSSNSSFVSDFKMSDIDWLLDYAINCELLDQEWIKYMSDGFEGELMAGPGEHSDLDVFYDVVYHLTYNQDNYMEAVQRLQANGTLENVTVTRGIGEKLWDFLADGLGGYNKRQSEKLRTIANEAGVFSDKDMRDKIFDRIDEKHRSGNKTSTEFWADVNAGKLDRPYSVLKDIRDIVASDDRPETASLAKKWQTAEDKLGYDKKHHIMDVVDEGKLLSNKGVAVVTETVDKLSGGGISKVQKYENYAQNVKKLKQAVFDGKTENCTESDVRTSLRKNGLDNLKSKIPKLGNETVDGIVGYVADKLEAEALKEDPTGNTAKEKGKTILDIKNNTEEKNKAVIVSDDKGNITVGIPDDKGNVKVPTDPGNKKITAVTEGGKRSTKATTAKKDGGKQEEKIDPEPTGDPKITASVSKVPFTANPKDNEKTATFTVTTNCKYFGVKAKDDPKWLTLKKDTKAGTVTVTVTPNSDQEPREAKIIIAGSNDKKTTVIQTEVLVTQEAPKPGKLSVSSDLIEFDYEGGSNFTIITCEGYEKMAVSVPSDCKDWLSASIKSTAAGNEIVSITAKPNESFKRTAVITLMAGNADKLTKDNSDTINITVEQAGVAIENMVFSVEDWVLEFDSKGGSKSTKVTTNADEVTATCNADWITMDVSKSSIKITVNENKSADKRQAEIIVKAKRAVKTSETSGYTEETTETIDIYQDGIEGYGNEILWGTWSYDNTSLELTNNGSFTYKSGSYSDSGSYKVTDFKCTAIFGTNGYNISGTLYGIKGEYWTFKTTYSKDGSGYYMKRQYCLTLTSKSSGSSIIVFKE